MEKISVKEYIKQFSINMQKNINTFRDLVLKLVPNFIELISYGMPAYKLIHKPLVYFEVYKNHIGLYALPSGHYAFEEALSAYKQGKESLQFPISQELLYDLIPEAILFNSNKILKQHKNKKISK